MLPTGEAVAVPVAAVPVVAPDVVAPDVVTRRAHPRSTRLTTRAATVTGSYVGENGGAYDRSEPASSSAVIPAQIAVARTSIRLPLPGPPTIWAPSSRPE